MLMDDLRLTNFRLFEQADVSFDNRISVVVGVNGAGKSTLLDAMGILLSCYLGGFDGQTTRRIAQADIRHVTYKHGTTYENVSQLPVELTASGTLAGSAITWSSLKTKDSPYSASPSAYRAATQLAAEHQERLRSGDSSLILPLIAYYGTGRLWQSEASEKKKEAQLQATFGRLKAYDDCLDAHLTNLTLVSWFERMAIKSLQSAKVNSEYTTVRRAVTNGLESITGLPGIDLGINFDTHELELIYDSDGEPIKVTSSQLSDGYRVVLSLFADIAYRAAMLNPQLEGSVLSETEGIVLIDEMDLHLHPQWQQLVLEALADTFPKMQFVVTTHAPAVVSSVDDGQLILIDGKQVLTVSNGFYGKDANTILREIMRTPERPREVRARFGKFYGLLDEGSYDEAEAVLDGLGRLLGEEDAELTACRVQLDLERMELA